VCRDPTKATLLGRGRRTAQGLCLLLFHHFSGLGERDDQRQFHAVLLRASVVISTGNSVTWHPLGQPPLLAAIGSSMGADGLRFKESGGVT